MMLQALPGTGAYIAVAIAFGIPAAPVEEALIDAPMTVAWRPGLAFDERWREGDF